MAIIGSSFQAPVALPSLLSSTEPSKKCEVALDRPALAYGFPVAHRCEGKGSTGLIIGQAAHKRYPVPELVVTSHPHGPGNHLGGTKLPLTHLVLAFYLVGQAKTGISSLAFLSRPSRCENYPNGMVLQNKIMQAMKERDGAMSLRG